MRTGTSRPTSRPGSFAIVTGKKPIERISAVTLVTGDMARAVQFYEAVGFERLYGGPDADFTSYRAGEGFLNLQLGRGVGADAGGQAGGGAVGCLGPPAGLDVWGRVIFWVSDVDALHRRVLEAGYQPEAAPSDAPWGERYFHVRDPDGHELSFARPL